MTILINKKLFKASIAVLLIDDYTDTQLSGSDFTLSIKGLGVKPIRKQDGFYIFANIAVGQAQIIVKSQKYIEETVDVLLNNQESSCPLVKIRLKPAVTYSLLPGTTAITAVIKSQENIPAVKADIQVIPDLKSCQYKVVDIIKSKKEDRIVLYNYGTRKLEGKQFLICDRKDTKKQEFFTISCQADEEGTFILKAPLKYDYKSDISIVQIYTSKTDQNGQILIPLDSVAAASFNATMNIGHNGKCVSKELKLTSGILNNAGTIVLTGN